MSDHSSKEIAALPVAVPVWLVWAGQKTAEAAIGFIAGRALSGLLGGGDDFGGALNRAVAEIKAYIAREVRAIVVEELNNETIRGVSENIQGCIRALLDWEQAPKHSIHRVQDADNFSARAMEMMRGRGLLGLLPYMDAVSLRIAAIYALYKTTGDRNLLKNIERTIHDGLMHVEEVRQDYRQKCYERYFSVSTRVSLVMFGNEPEKEVPVFDPGDVPNEHWNKPGARFNPEDLQFVDESGRPIVRDEQGVDAKDDEAEATISDVGGRKIKRRLYRDLSATDLRGTYSYTKQMTVSPAMMDRAKAWWQAWLAYEIGQFRINFWNQVDSTMLEWRKTRMLVDKV